MNATIQIAEVLNVSPNQIKSVREMAWVYCVVVFGKRATFVSKKKVEAITVEGKQLISAEDGAKKLAQMVGGRFWAKGGHTRVYTKHGYLSIAPETVTSAQVCYYTKSYEIKDLSPSVQAFNDLYTVSASVSSGPVRVVMQEDEDGCIAPAGQHDPDAHIVREWVEMR